MGKHLGIIRGKRLRNYNPGHILSLKFNSFGQNSGYILLSTMQKKHKSYQNGNFYVYICIK
ncbi:MAG: hypothetical protein EA362_00420 [Saprospirales bacterium]|nr:MAG: hypothetical protein EA362_00420 [Saprospirales bacterium]